jgi:hypothetical protein
MLNVNAEILKLRLVYLLCPQLPERRECLAVFYVLNRNVNRRILEGNEIADNFKNYKSVQKQNSGPGNNDLYQGG